jgi:glycosyltransferase involved in cell wall biosynthesis
LQPDLWLSLHDITPNVRAKRRAVYCHNPAPFYRLSWKEAALEPKLQLFSWFYGYLYRINIGKNRFVIVQQDWLRSALGDVGSRASIIVAHPYTSIPPETAPSARMDADKHVFLYPALPRVFKNFEVLCEAVAQMPESVSAKCEIRLTIDGSENRYARYLRRRFGGIANVSFIGRQTRERMLQQYAEADVICFPSRLETWGLPITEAKSLRKPLLAADLPYAHETVGRYDRVLFLPARNPEAWAQAMQASVEGRLRFGRSESAQPAQPFAAGWPDLWRILTEGL